jgi:hypothetical protein
MVEAQVMFNMSAGLMFPPNLAKKHGKVVDKLNLWEHGHFKTLK